MLSSDHLATMAIHRVIFHDVPNNAKDQSSSLVLASAETVVDAPRRTLLRDKLIRVLGSKSSYPIVFDPQTSSPVPEIVRQYTRTRQDAEVFVTQSRDLAKHLHQMQHGAISPGLLCVIDFRSGGRLGLVLMKLEREAGAQLTLDRIGSKKRFAMSVLEDLVLTDGTRLFKTAAFLRQAAGANNFLMSACDSQHRVTDSSDMARFWIRYLGCALKEDPRVTTSKFYNSTLSFINTSVADPVLRTQMYDSLHAELQSNKTQVVPKQFIQEFVPKELKNDYQQHLESAHVSLTTFEKDTVDISSKLKRKTYYSERGVVIAAPSENNELVKVGRQKIVVHDRLQRVGRT